MLAPAPRLALADAVAVAAAGVGWRLTDLREWPFPFHPTVQYEAAIAARSLWVAADPADRAEFDHTPDLRAAAERRGTPVPADAGVLVYDLRR